MLVKIEEKRKGAKVVGQQTKKQDNSVNAGCILWAWQKGNQNQERTPFTYANQVHTYTYHPYSHASILVYEE